MSIRRAEHARFVRLQAVHLVLLVVGDQRLAFKSLKQRAGDFLIGPVAGDAERLTIQVARKGIDAGVFFQQRLEAAIDNDREGMAQAYELLIVIEDGIRIAQGCFSVDRLVVRIDGNPRRTAGKAGVPARIPLHRRACIVASDCVEASEHCLGRDLLLLVDVLVPGVDFLEVPAVGERVEGRVRHAELFALVDVGRALLHVQASREHLGGEHAPLGAVVAEHRNAARLVVIVEVERVPGLALKLQLPLVEDGADIRHLRFARRPLVDDAALAVFRADVLKLEDHAEFLAVAAGVLLGLVDRDARCLADG